MSGKIKTREELEKFAEYLKIQEKSPATQQKYLRDARAFLEFLCGREVEKKLVLGWKKALIAKGYSARTINSMLASINSLLDFWGRADSRVKNIRLQQQIYCAPERELTREEYLRLLSASRQDERMNLLLQTICATGIRVSELCHFTVQAVGAGEVRVDCKGKTRIVLVPEKLKKRLLGYAKKRKISAGPIFITRTGRPLDRSNIWAAMKRLCRAAGVAETKGFPHNLRKLFATSFYTEEKDIAKLADILGHSSINTTRIYIMTTGTEHRRKIERLGLVV